MLNISDNVLSNGSRLYTNTTLLSLVSFLKYHVYQADQRSAFQVVNELTKVNQNEQDLPAAPSTRLCNTFVTYFDDKISTIQLTIAQKMVDEEIPTDWTHAIDRNPPIIMHSLEPVSEPEIEKLLKSINSKTCDLDPCPTSLLKQSASGHVETLVAIFNASFRQGIFPQHFKSAQVKPLLKKSTLDKTHCKNFRPVSNLPTLGKVMERLAVNRLNNHIQESEKHEIFQSAYKPLHSTETALLRVFNDVATCLDSRRVMLLSMIDLYAAFDTICHDKLIRLLDVEYETRHWPGSSRILRTDIS